jgi:hypothetical protein
MTIKMMYTSPKIFSKIKEEKHRHVNVTVDVDGKSKAILLATFEILPHSLKIRT